MRKVIFEIDGTEYPHRNNGMFLCNSGGDYGKVFKLLGMDQESKKALAEEAYGCPVSGNEAWPRARCADPEDGILRLLTLLAERYPVKITIDGVTLVTKKLKLENVLLI